MKLLEKILLATDFSKSCENLLKYAIELGKIFHSQIILVHVLPNNIKDEKVKMLLKQASVKQLDEIRGEIESAGLKTEKPILLSGNPFDKIIQAANSVNANLILIGAGEKSKNDSFQLGLTAFKIIRKSNKPVWVVKSGELLNIQKILCPVDFSPESKRALKNTITLARKFKIELIIFSVGVSYRTSSTRLQLDWDKEIERERLEHINKFNLFLKNFNLSNISWSKEIKFGYPANEIRNAISKYKADLVIMGTTEKSGFDRLMLGSVTESVIRKVPCSFISLKNEDIIDLPLENKICDIESHYRIAEQLINRGLLQDAIREYKICLNISDMHIPSLIRISEVYKKLEHNAKAEEYKRMATDILSRIWDKKIEDEIRMFYKI